MDVKEFITIVVSFAVIVFFLRPFFRKVRRFHYYVKSVFRGRWFHDHYIDTTGKLKIVYRTDFGMRFWTLMGRIYSTVIIIIPLFFLLVRLDGTQGYALVGNDYKAGDTVMVYDVSNFRTEIGHFVSYDYEELTVEFENDTGIVKSTGFVIGKYYKEPLTMLSAPGLFVRSFVADLKAVATLFH